jgi:hypothetical protein
MSCNVGPILSQSKFSFPYHCVKSIPQDESEGAGIATDYGLDNRGVGVRVPEGSRMFSSPRGRDRLWAHSSSYPMGTGGSFPAVKRPGVKLTTRLQLVLRSRKCESIHPLPQTA